MSWYEESGADKLAKNSALIYAELCLRAEQPGAVLEADARQIALDVPRTGVSLYRYCCLKNVTEDDVLDMKPLKPFMDCLKRILTTYSARNIRVGYVQGHGDVVCYILGSILKYYNITHNICKDGVDEDIEAQVFWVYCVLMERIFPSDFFSRTPKLQGFHVDMDVLSLLIQRKLPTLAAILTQVKKVLCVCVCMYFGIVLMLLKQILIKNRC